MGLVAGEASGDNLGAGLIRAIRQQHADVEFFGIAGPAMVAEGCQAWESSDSLAVMGLFEVLHHLPRLWRLRRATRQRFLAERPDVFVGIDAPEFNLSLAPALHQAGIPTVQYVSPQVWAWRRGRAGRMAGFLDLVLCLLPFEPEVYAEHGLRAEFVGHPLADLVPMQPDRPQARQRLGLALERPVAAILPGSRLGEVKRLGNDFAATVAWLAARRPELSFVAPMAGAATRAVFAEALSRHAPGIPVILTQGGARDALAAADVVLVASGTATLETLLHKRPMVVAYRVGGLTAFALKQLGLLKSPFFAQPNLLAGRLAVPEFSQAQVTAERLGTEMLRWLDNPAAVAALVEEFAGIHARLRAGGSSRAAEAILDVLKVRP